MNANRRELSGISARLVLFMAALVPVSALVYAMRLLPEIGVIIYKEQFLAFFLSVCLMITFMVKPATAKAVEVKVPWYDVVFDFCHVRCWRIYSPLVPRVG